MENEKIENLLNLALDATPEELDKSLDLDVGYDAQQRTWEVIVKYGGTTAGLENLLRENFPQTYSQIRITNLRNEYAILILPEAIVNAVASLPEIEYMEKPKRLFFAVNRGKRASCISQLQTGSGAGIPDTGRNNLTGRDVIVAIIDSGIDYAHPDFRNADGTTRIIELWDQTIPSGSVSVPVAGEGGVGRRNEGGTGSGNETQNENGSERGSETGRGSENGNETEREAGNENRTLSENSGENIGENNGESDERILTAPEGFLIGTVFDSEIINHALDQPTDQARYAICPSRDISGHGTHVAGIAAGNGRASNGRYRGVAFESELLVVKLGLPLENGFPRTTELMQAVDYCLGKSTEYGKPIVVNLSFGNNYGSHSGNSLIETYLDDMANYGRTTIAAGSGNEGSASVHTSGRVAEGQTERVELAVSEFETALNLQIWKSYVDEIAVSIVHPGGLVVGPIQRIQGPQRFTVENTQLLLYYGEPSPYSPFQEIYFDFIPVRDYIDSGVWEIRLVPQRIVQGRYDMWLPSGGVLNSGTGFLYPTEETTLTIPSTAARVITVGAYDALFDQPASFSGRGYTRETNQVKPDLAAPGVEITSCAPGGGYVARTGTSMATPFVSGGAALLMQWGIVNGNDPYLYGEKMKAYLIRGARELPVFEEYPNPVLGWGVLCVAESLPL